MNEFGDRIFNLQSKIEMSKKIKYLSIFLLLIGFALITFGITALFYINKVLSVLSDLGINDFAIFSTLGNYMSLLTGLIISAICLVTNNIVSQKIKLMEREIAILEKRQQLMISQSTTLVNVSPTITCPKCKNQILKSTETEILRCERCGTIYKNPDYPYHEG